jgi:Bacterial TniB protein
MKDQVQGVEALRAFLDEDDKRVATIMAKLKSCYVGSSRDDEMAAQLKLLIENSLQKRFPKKPEADWNRAPGTGFGIVGQSGAGKTTAIEKLMCDHPAFPGYGVPGSGCIFVSVLVPSPCTLAQLGNAVIEALGYFSDEKEFKENQAWHRVRMLLPKAGVRFLHFDDIHNVLQQNKKEVDKVRATLRNLMISRVWPVQLILSGTEEAVELFDFEDLDAEAEDANGKNDRQLSRRLEYVTFDDVDPAADSGWLKNVTVGFAGEAELTYEDRAGAMLLERLCHAAAYQFGLTIELLLRAIKVALSEKSETLGVDHFARAYAKRTLQPAQLNVFVSPAWQSIDPTIILKKKRKGK